MRNADLWQGALPLNHDDDPSDPNNQPEWTEVIACPQCGRAVYEEPGDDHQPVLVDYWLEADGSTTRAPHAQDCPGATPRPHGGHRG